MLASGSPADRGRTRPVAGTGTTGRSRPPDEQRTTTMTPAMAGVCAGIRGPPGPVRVQSSSRSPGRVAAVTRQYLGERACRAGPAGERACAGADPGSGDQPAGAVEPPMFGQFARVVARVRATGVGCRAAGAPEAAGAGLAALTIATPPTAIMPTDRRVVATSRRTPERWWPGAPAARPAGRHCRILGSMGFHG